MGYFDLPTGNLELRIDGEWESVCFADTMGDDEVAAFAVKWSDWGHSVSGARYNGVERNIPKGKLVVEYTMPADGLPHDCSQCQLWAKKTCPRGVSNKAGTLLSKYTRTRHGRCPLTFIPFE